MDSGILIIVGLTVLGFIYTVNTIFKQNQITRRKLLDVEKARIQAGASADGGGDDMSSMMALLAPMLAGMMKNKGVQNVQTVPAEVQEVPKEIQ